MRMRFCTKNRAKSRSIKLFVFFNGLAIVKVINYLFCVYFHGGVEYNVGGGLWIILGIRDSFCG